jgi:hypothetical protein
MQDRADDPTHRTGAIYGLAAPGPSTPTRPVRGTGSRSTPRARTTGSS